MGVFIGVKCLRIKINYFFTSVYNRTFSVLLPNGFRVAGQTFKDRVKLQHVVVHTQTFLTRVWIERSDTRLQTFPQ